MAKGPLTRVVRRLVSSSNSYIPSRCSISNASHQRSIADSMTPGDVNNNRLLAPGNVVPLMSGHSLWMKSSPEMNYEKDSLLDTIGNLKDDQEIQRELSLNSTELHSSNEPNRTMVDTHAMVKSLMAGGFTLQQAETLTTAMVGVVDVNSTGIRQSMVSKPQAQLTVQKIASQLAILRRDMMIMEKTDFTELITKIERITHELLQLQQTTKDEMTKIRSDMTLDFNLEKAKVKDMHLDHLRVVENKHAIIFEKLNTIDKELQNIRSYINTENASLQTTFERYKSDTVKLAFGAVATCMTIVLGFYRIWS